MLLAVVATAMLTGLFVDELDHTYPLRVVAGLLVLVWYRNDHATGLRAHLRGRRLITSEHIAIAVVV